MPYADPERRRAWHQQRDRQRRSAHKCRRCGTDTSGRGTAYCFPCAVHRSAVKRAARRQVSA